MTSDDEVIGNAAAAAYVGIGEKTWSAYVTRKNGRQHAPQPHRREISGGHALPVWTKTALDEWKAGRPGRGARTELRKTESAPTTELD